MIFPSEVELEPERIGLIASFDGSWVTFRVDESLALDPDKSLLVDLRADHGVGWGDRDVLVFILPRDFGDLEVVVTLEAGCPLGADHPLCQPGLPVARVSVRG
ncbi:MAG: hypothetical protein QI223_02285 [Candidatus Korarchaeota archaeon]|nr:hypothetical protein [Candidatus Korarchaeota archaeon]